SLTDECPVYHRPVGAWSRPDQIKVPLDPPPHILEELKKPRDYTADLKELLASPNICSKRWVFEQYDSMVQTNTVQGPGGEAGVMRIKGTGTIGPDGTRHERGLAMALAGNGRWCYLDPKLGAMHAVAEAARKVACTGATPVAATNCLNFGNPEKPEIMAQFSAAIDGIAEACTALGTPITGGNVSLYNETRGEGIYPTPVVGVVGILDDVTKAVPNGFAPNDEMVAILGTPSSKETGDLQQEFGTSEFATTILGESWGRPPQLDLAAHERLLKFVQEIATAGLISSAQDVGTGGVAVTLAKSCMSAGVGLQVNLSGLRWESQIPSDVPDKPTDGIWTESALFGEHPSVVIVSGTVPDIGAVVQMAHQAGISQYGVGTIDEKLSGELIISNRNPWARDYLCEIEVPIKELRSAFSTALESQLAAEVTA
ncbi:MAG TPA: AIR synthase related protein, partial [Acidobacteriaceae bacterium]